MPNPNQYVPTEWERAVLKQYPEANVYDMRNRLIPEMGQNVDTVMRNIMMTTGGQTGAINPFDVYGSPTQQIQPIKDWLYQLDKESAEKAKQRDIERAPQAIGDQYKMRIKSDGGIVNLNRLHRYNSRPVAVQTDGNGERQYRTQGSNARVVIPEQQMQYPELAPVYIDEYRPDIPQSRNTVIDRLSNYFG